MSQSIGLEYESEKKITPEGYVYVKKIKMFIPIKSLQYSPIHCHVAQEEIED
jgi:hypothetical protein